MNSKNNINGGTGQQQHWRHNRNNSQTCSRQGQLLWLSLATSPSLFLPLHFLPGSGGESGGFGWERARAKERFDMKGELLSKQVVAEG